MSEHESASIPKRNSPDTGLDTALRHDSVSNWESEVRKELEPLIGSFKRVARELTNLVKLPEYEQLLGKAGLRTNIKGVKTRLEPEGLLKAVQWHAEEAESVGLASAIKFTQQKELEAKIADPKSRALEAFFDTSLRFGNGTTMTNLLRLRGFIEGYCGFLASADVPPNATAKIAIDEQWTTFQLKDPTALKFYQEARQYMQACEEMLDQLDQLDIHFHRLNFARTMSDRDYNELCEDNQGNGPLAYYTKIGAAVCEYKPIVYRKTRQNNPNPIQVSEVVDVSAWGLSSTRFPDLSGKTHAWFKKY